MKRKENTPWTQAQILESICPQRYRKLVVALAVLSGTIRRMA